MNLSILHKGMALTGWIVVLLALAWLLRTGWAWAWAWAQARGPQAAAQAALDFCGAAGWLAGGAGWAVSTIRAPAMTTRSGWDWAVYSLCAQAAAMSLGGVTTHALAWGCTAGTGVWRRRRWSATGSCCSGWVALGLSWHGSSTACVWHSGEPEGAEPGSGARFAGCQETQ